MLKKAFILLTAYGLLLTAVFALKLGETPPDFSLPNLEGKTIQLNDYLSKETVVLSFFASWSKSCQKEMSFLRELNTQYQKEGLKILGVSFDRKTKGLQSFIKDKKIDFEILYDKKLSTLDDFQILIIPTLLVINSDGTLKNIYIDFDENVEEALAKEIQELLNPSKE